MGNQAFAFVFIWKLCMDGCQVGFVLCQYSSTGTMYPRISFFIYACLGLCRFLNPQSAQYLEAENETSAIFMLGNKNKVRYYCSS